MAKLSKKETDLLKSLQAKAEAPDAPAANRVLNISVDLGDEKQVARAMSLGLLEAGESTDGDDDGDGGGDGDDDDDDDGPVRRGSYFGS